MSQIGYSQIIDTSAFINEVDPGVRAAKLQAKTNESQAKVRAALAVTKAHMTQKIAVAQADLKSPYQGKAISWTPIPIVTTVTLPGGVQEVIGTQEYTLG